MHQERLERGPQTRGKYLEVLHEGLERMIVPEVALALGKPAALASLDDGTHAPGDETRCQLGSRVADREGAQRFRGVACRDSKEVEVASAIRFVLKFAEVERQPRRGVPSSSVAVVVGGTRRWTRIPERVSERANHELFGRRPANGFP